MAVFHYKPQAIVHPLENSTLKSLKALAYSETEMVIKKDVNKWYVSI